MFLSIVYLFKNSFQYHFYCLIAASNKKDNNRYNGGYDCSAIVCSLICYKDRQIFLFAYLVVKLTSCANLSWTRSQVMWMAVAAWHGDGLQTHVRMPSNRTLFCCMPLPVQSLICGCGYLDIGGGITIFASC